MSQMNREQYAKKKLSGRISELEVQVSDLEFSILVLQEEKEKLQKQMDEFMKAESLKETKEVPPAQETEK